MQKWSSKRAAAPETRQVDDVERGDVVGAPLEVVLPEALLPEAEAVHLAAGLAERRVPVRRALQQCS